MIKNTEIATRLRQIADGVEAGNIEFVASQGYIEHGPFAVTRSLRVELNPNAYDVTAVQIEWRERVQRTDDEVEALKIRAANSKRT